MKKFTLIFIAGLIAFSLNGCKSDKAADKADAVNEVASDQAETDGDDAAEGVSMVNPMVPLTDEAEIEKYAHGLKLPDAAGNVEAFLISGEIFEWQFDRNGISYVARAQESETYEDISGCYYTWDEKKEEQIPDMCPGDSMKCEADGEAVALCTWYDPMECVNYSLMATAPSLDDFDIMEVVCMMFSGEDSQTEDSSEVTGTMETITPIVESIDTDNVPDGEYPVSVFFDNVRQEDGQCVLDCMLYTVVSYDKEVMENMVPGDTVYEPIGETDGETYPVESLEFDDGFITVNGGCDEGGINFMLNEAGAYQIQMASDATRYSAQGIMAIKIPADVTFIDDWALEHNEVSGSDLYDYFNAVSEDDKNTYNEAEMRVEFTDGKVTGFRRIFVP